MLKTAKYLAEARSVSLGRIISDLVRKALEESKEIKTNNGLPVFSLPPGAAPITLDDVKKLDDEL